MFSLLRKWGREFHKPYQFSALEAHLVLRHWELGQIQGHRSYIEGRLMDLQQKEGD